MNRPYPPIQVKVWGDLAVFTRPEHKVERVSYDVITPSAARGVLEAIFWKPQMRWQIHEIHVLKPIKHLSFQRNEVKNRASPLVAQRWAHQSGNFYADDRENRTQRHTLALRDVAYVIVANIVVPDGAVDPAKYRDQFRRRVANGQCHHRPYLGCREFAASFGPIEPADRPENITSDLGYMLLDLLYQADDSGRGKPYFFRAKLEQGILVVPPTFYTGS